MNGFLFGGAKLNTVVGDLGLFVLRAFSGLSLSLAHGFGKLPPSSQFMAGVEGLGLPAQMAWLSGFAEGIGGLALAAGLLTRPAALLIAINMSVAAFMRHANDPYQVKELPFLFLAVAIMYACVGGGRFSADRMIRR